MIYRCLLSVCKTLMFYITILYTRSSSLNHAIITFSPNKTNFVFQQSPIEYPFIFGYFSKVLYKKFLLGFKVEDLFRKVFCVVFAAPSKVTFF